MIRASASAPAGDEPLLATAWSLHLPGAAVHAAVSADVGVPRWTWATEPAVRAEDAATLLGRKGLLAKDPATRLALCAVHRALGLAPGVRPRRSPAPETAVVVASNLGNLEAVARVARTVSSEGGAAVSVLDAPNVSSNVIASTVALWFGFGGPNLMVCSGAAAGLDALRLAGLLLRARRAERVVLVGVEPDDAVAAALHGGGPAPLRAGAACLVLQRVPDSGAGVPGSVLLHRLGRGTRWPEPPRLIVGAGGGAVDPVRHWGDHDGAQGVVALALAAHLAADEGHLAVGVRCADVTGASSVLVSVAALAGRRR